ncbi:MAG: ribonuclease III [Selenomonadales bacterium]|nr:ribonuclease III [Selenomonadales bacterium]
MRFRRFQNERDRLLKAAVDDIPQKDAPPEQMNPLVLAYIGDAYFSLYVRTRMIAYEKNKMQALHAVDAKVVSASMQAVACRMLEEYLTDTEREVLRRGRNAKSQVPKSATVGEYRASTAFEAILGYWYLKGDMARLDEMAEKSFRTILNEMNKESEGN